MNSHSKMVHNKLDISKFNFIIRRIAQCLFLQWAIQKWWICIDLAEYNFVVDNTEVSLSNYQLDIHLLNNEIQFLNVESYCLLTHEYNDRYHTCKHVTTMMTMKLISFRELKRNSMDKFYNDVHVWLIHRSKDNSHFHHNQTSVFRRLKLISFDLYDDNIHTNHRLIFRAKFNLTKTK